VSQSQYNRTIIQVQLEFITQDVWRSGMEKEINSTLFRFTEIMNHNTPDGYVNWDIALPISDMLFV
jgi:hypothetical protein